MAQDRLRQHCILLRLCGIKQQLHVSVAHASASHPATTAQTHTAACHSTSHSAAPHLKWHSLNRHW
jgi:hypothetical protein